MSEDILMLKFLWKKIVSIIVTLFIVSLLVFLAFAVIPGDPAVHQLGTQATPLKVEALRHTMGLDRPVMVRYAQWALSFIKGDMGKSYSYSMPVRGMIADKLPITLTLTTLAFVIMLLISVPLGIHMAKHKGSRQDLVLTAVNQVFMSIPSFFGGIIITFIFGKIFHLFTPGGYVSYHQNAAAFLGYMIFPALAVAIPKSAMCTKLLKESILKEYELDYVRTAFSRGNRTNEVLYGHVLKNALIPVITFLGMTYVDMMAGSIIIEQVFSIPGIGRTLLSSISNRDYPVVEAIIMCIAFTAVVANFAVDIIYKAVDPRITEAGE